MTFNQNDIFNIPEDKTSKIGRVLIFFSGYNAISIIVRDFMKQLSEIYSESLEFKFYNLDEDKHLFGKTKITNVPTILFIKDDELFDFVMGPKSKKELTGKLDALLTTASSHI